MVIKQQLNFLVKTSNGHFNQANEKNHTSHFFGTLVFGDMGNILVLF